MREDADTSMKAILRLEKEQFDEALISKAFPAEIESSVQYFQNDVYYKYHLHLTKDYTRIQCNFIYPATQVLIDKYSKQEVYVVRETPEMYEKYTKKEFIDKVNPDDC
jgi:m7GpppX diphosphatase